MGATPFQTEAWTEYGIGTLFLFLRYFARWRVVGFKGWQGDDYFAVLVLVFWTLELCMLELIGQYGTNIGIYDEIGKNLSKEQIARYEFGSKCLLMGWNFYVTLIWCLKASMLCFYNRMTLGLRQQTFVKWTAVACVFAYAGVLGSIWGHCVPVQKNWQVYPYPGDQCTLAVANYITLVVLNVVTDIALVAIPLPLLWKVQLPLGRKLAIGVLLCSGVFIIVATLLRCILSLQSIQGINVSTIWAIRETFVGIIAVNAAAIKPLFSSSRWLSSSKGNNGSPPGESSNTGSKSHALVTIGGSNTTASRHRRRPSLPYTDIVENSSEENIFKPDLSHLRGQTKISATSDGRVGAFPGAITVTTQVDVDDARHEAHDRPHQDV
ncbi:hypothetical protein ACRE_077240 [Hapsidospora chrysogenum ATCC 11550]|uniref:Rhodopsin domain-containing protein n=1 Tax=Hapsidospora chrysogenum (strain ATCC 11550 / CBS 779.69 / DSM 880 / IAM 14645 / JCM 23072 / IMI 49137) TaxID=857340 RepID=A0A086SWT2_HAPC1|nr:hypothetical protein ACRE_077240 [Hapsidospora chrysogenum ATCC 11550]